MPETQMELSQLALLIIFAASTTICLPARPLNDRSTELVWEAWLLVDQQNSDPTKQQHQVDAALRRRITPKSVFVAPDFRPDLLPPCAEGYRADPMGRCVKIIKIDEGAHLEFLLQQLSRFGEENEEEVAEVVVEEEGGGRDEGPVQFNIPLDGSGEEGDGDGGDGEEEERVAILVAPTGNGVGSGEVVGDVVERNGTNEGLFVEVKRAGPILDVESGGDKEDVVVTEETTVGAIDEGTTEANLSDTPTTTETTVETTTEEPTTIPTTTPEITETTTTIDLTTTEIQQAIFFLNPYITSTTPKTEPSTTTTARVEPTTPEHLPKASEQLPVASESFTERSETRRVRFPAPETSSRVSFREVEGWKPSSQPKQLVFKFPSRVGERVRFREDRYRGGAGGGRGGFYRELPSRDVSYWFGGGGGRNGRLR